MSGIKSANISKIRLASRATTTGCAGTAFLGMDGDTLFVSAPDRETRAWLESEFGPPVRNAVRELGSAMFGM